MVVKGKLVINFTFTRQLFLFKLDEAGVSYLTNFRRSNKNNSDVNFF